MLKKQLTNGMALLCVIIDGLICVLLIYLFIILPQKDKEKNQEIKWKNFTLPNEQGAIGFRDNNGLLYQMGMRKDGCVMWRTVEDYNISNVIEMTSNLKN